MRDCQGRLNSCEHDGTITALLDRFDGKPLNAPDDLGIMADGARCYTPGRDLIGKHYLPETCSNLCFDGRKRTRLFTMASTSVYAVYVEAMGTLLP